MHGGSHEVRRIITFMQHDSTTDSAFCEGHAYAVCLCIIGRCCDQFSDGPDMLDSSMHTGGTAI